MLGNDVYNEISLCIRYSSPVSIYLLGGGLMVEPACASSRNDIYNSCIMTYIMNEMT